MTDEEAKLNADDLRNKAIEQNQAFINFILDDDNDLNQLSTKLMILKLHREAITDDEYSIAAMLVKKFKDLGYPDGPEILEDAVRTHIVEVYGEL